jgi:hypothetical protein
MDLKGQANKPDHDINYKVQSNTKNVNISKVSKSFKSILHTLTIHNPQNKNGLKIIFYYYLTGKKQSKTNRSISCKERKNTSFQG